MMHLLLVLPLLIPLFTAALSIPLLQRVRLQRAVSVCGASANLAACLLLLSVVWQHGIQATQVAGWAAPFGITLVSDLLSAVMLVLAALTGLAVTVYSLDSIGERRERFGFHPLLHILLMGVCGAFLTGDVFNLYVCFEIMLIASFVLLALGGERAQLEGALKYVVINLVASGFFLAATGILYGAAGTLNMADAAVWLRQAENPGNVSAIAMLFLAAFGIKAGAFPFFFWLPASYHTPPVAVSAVFAGLLTKVGVYALIRFFTLIFDLQQGWTQELFLVIAALTMVTGVLGAACQNEVRRILSFHIISQIGYMIFGLALYTPLAIAGSVFYLTHHIVVKANLFLIGGVIRRLGGSYQLDRVGGLSKSYPALGLLFLIPALSLAGLPPLSGFWAKFILIKAGIESAHYLLVAVALAVGLMTLYSMSKIWTNAFWAPAPDLPPEGREAPEPDTESGGSSSGRKGLREMPLLIGPVIVLAVITVLIGLLVEPVFRLAERASLQLLDSQGYIDTVLGGS